MTTTAVEKAAPTPTPAAAFVGQATAIEQSRAVAEVQAAVVVAQQCPRSVQAAQEGMRESCRQQGLADRAFFRYSRGGSSITGPTIHLARELARCWGNIQYGVAELRRDDVAGESEMQAYAWDVQTNTRSALIFVVPHKRDKRGGAEKLVDLRDVYENNANNGARRLRQAIFSVLPPWYVEEAKALCTATLEHGAGDKPLAQRVADAVALFDGLGVKPDQLEQRLGRDRDRWTGHDLAQLRVTYNSLRNGEITVDEEFPPQRVSADEITQRATAPPAATPPTAKGKPIGATQSKRMHALCNELGLTDRAKRLAVTSTAVGRAVDSSNDLTADEASTLIDRLVDLQNLDPEERPLVIAEMAEGEVQSP